MCGIVGFLTTSPRPDDGSVLARMAGVLAHRGPDAEGFHTEENIFLGHRRLSIIDLATGHQPMANEDGSRWIVYNGEVFNHAGLRPELEAAGHRYHSRSDTETILHAYEQHGPAALERFRGMFAFAIWDADRRTLFCARDRLGIKPFYYYFDGRLFAFASEIKALLEHPAIRAEFDETALPEYLAFGYLSGEKTMFRGIRKLMPGHHMTLRLEGGGLRQDIQRYWDVPLPEGEDLQADWVGECRRRLEETVRMRLMSDVPLGMFLSGGLDSSLIAAYMRRMADRPIQTFSVGYGEQAHSELGYARRVAGFIGSEHREVVIGAREFFEALPKLVWHEDEPIAWPSSVSLYFVSRLASEHVKVVLTGEGSDELFAGYHRYSHYQTSLRLLPYYRLLPGALREAVRRAIAGSRWISAGLRRKLQHTLLGQGEDLTSLFVDNFYSAFSAQAQQTLLRRNGGSPYYNYLRCWNQREGCPLLDRMLYADQKTYLVELLMKQDQMSMACSLESRVPLLDHTLVEFASQVPAGMKIRGAGKYIVKKAAEGLLPDDIIHRTKMGFPTPLRQWFRQETARPLLEGLALPGGFLAEHLKSEAIRTLIDSHWQGREDATDRLWRLLNLETWGRVFLRRQ